MLKFIRKAHLWRTTTLLLDPQMMDSWDLRFTIQRSVSTVLKSVWSLSLFLFNQASVIFSSSIWTILLIVNFIDFDVYSIPLQFFSPFFLLLPLTLLSYCMFPCCFFIFFFFCLGRIDASLRIHNSNDCIIISLGNQSSF